MINKENLTLFDSLKKEVPYSNSFSETVFDKYSVREKKLLLVLVSGIKDKKDSSYKFNPKDIKKLINMKNQSYKDLAKLVFEIQKKPILTFNKEKNRLDSISLFTKVSFLANDESIIVNFSEDAKEFFLGLRGNFSKYFIENIKNLSSEKSIELYLRAESSIFKKSFTMSLKDIEIFLQKKYSKNLESRIIKSSVDDINEKTNIHIEYTKIKEGRKIVAFKFFPTRSSKLSDELSASIDIAKKNIYILKAITFDMATIQKLLCSFTEEELIEGLKLAYKKINKSFKTLSYLQKTIKSCLEENQVKVTAKKEVNTEALISEILPLESQNDSSKVLEIWNVLEEPLKSEIEKKAVELLLKKDKVSVNFIDRMKNDNYSIYCKTLSKYIFSVIDSEYNFLNKNTTNSLIEIKPIIEEKKSEKIVKKRKGRPKKLDMLDKLNFEEEVVKVKKQMITYLRKKLGKENIKELFNKFSEEEEIKFLIENYVDFLKSKEEK